MEYEVDGISYNIKIERKKIKNLYIRFKDGTIHINTPFLIKEKKIYKILDDNINSLRKMIKRDVKKNDWLFLGREIDIVIISNLKKPEYANGKLFVKNKDKIDEAYQFLAEPIFKERLEYIYNQFQEDVPFPLLKIRKMTSRWGVCNRNSNSITLNLQLIKWDVIYIDYVIIHELSHFVYFDHSKHFWDLVSKYCPQYKEIRKKLRE
ncbi:MAG: DUF45 domain-containing protein [Bacilli bacterium]|nr:DUF45 domain-containing protein [Bacilli bacterium]